MKKVFYFCLCLLMPFGWIETVSAHPGGTDSRGCHTCRTNCTKWGLRYGEYHCHRPRQQVEPQDQVTSGPTYRTLKDRKKKGKFVPRVGQLYPNRAPMPAPLVDIEGIQVKIPYGQVVAKVRAGFYSRTEEWSIAASPMLASGLIDPLEEELVSLGYSVVASVGMFEQPSYETPDFRIGGTIKDLKAEKVITNDFWTGFPRISRSRIWLQIHWQIYDSSQGRVVAELTTEGFAEVKRADYPAALVPSVLSSFRNFLSSRTAHSVLHDQD